MSLFLTTFETLTSPGLPGSLELVGMISMAGAEYDPAERILAKERDRTKVVERARRTWTMYSTEEFVAS